MRIKDDIESSGYFWLPSAPERKIPGTLFIRDGGKIELEVVGLFDDSIEGLNRALNGNGELFRIIGHIEKYGLVTLDARFYVKNNISFGGISKSTIFAHRVLAGIAYDDNEIVLINNFKFSVEGIDEWVGISGIKTELESNDKDGAASISYIPPDAISFNLNIGMKLLIEFSWTHSVSPSLKEAKITQKLFFELTSDQERSLDVFISAAHKITTFLCFAIDKTVCIEQISIASDAIRQEIGNGRTLPVSILLFYPSEPYIKSESRVDLYSMLFRFGQIREVFEQMLNNWFDAYEKIAPALNLYFSVKTGAHKYLNSNFLALAQGLETCHRRTLNAKLMEEESFKELTEKLIMQCPEEHRDWLSGRLQHGNEVSFSRRIKGIMEPFKDFFGKRDEQKKLINSIVVTRNYLTHYDETLKLEAAAGRDLLLLCLRMEAIFQLYLLYVLGFTQSEVSSILENSNELRHKLKKDIK